MSDTAISLRQVRKVYPGGVAGVREVTLDIARGTFVTLLGPSGSGKTTTLMMLAGFEEPTSGQILIDGADVTRVPPYDRNLGMVFQNYALFPHMTVAQNIEFPLRVRRMDAQSRAAAVAKALALVKLEGFGGRRPAELSGGQQQRVALARALVFNPPILLMDEPMGALDKKLRQHMQLELKGIQQALGITVVYVTHDQEEAMSMSDRIVVMNNGCIEQADSPHRIYHQPESRFVADFLGDTNFVSGDDLNSLHGHADSAAPRYEAAVLHSLRPEAIDLHRDVAAERFGPVVVQQVVFLGDSTRYQVRLPNGQQLWARAQNGRYDFAIDVGHALWVNWRREHIVPIQHADRAQTDPVDRIRQREQRMENS